MSLKNIEIPLYTSMGEDTGNKLTVNEFAGRIVLEIKKGDVEIEIEFYFDDFERAWKAVRKGW